MICLTLRRSGRLWWPRSCWPGWPRTCGCSPGRRSSTPGETPADQSPAKVKTRSRGQGWCLTCQGQRPYSARVPLMIRPLLRLGSLRLCGSSSFTSDLPHICSRDVLKYSGAVFETLYFGNLDSSLIFSFGTSSLPESQPTLSLYEQRFFPLILYYH